MTITDKHGRKIELGSNIIYPSVGTIGTVKDIKEDEMGSWVLIDVGELEQLWYNTKYVELTDEEPINYLKENNDKDLSVEDIKEKLNENVSSEMSGDSVGGG